MVEVGGSVDEDVLRDFDSEVAGAGVVVAQGLRQERDEVRLGELPRRDIDEDAEREGFR